MSTKPRSADPAEQRNQYRRHVRSVLVKSEYQQSPLVVGLMAGFIGSKVVDRSGDALVRDIILGISVVGDAIFVELGLVGVTRVNLTSIR